MNAKRKKVLFFITKSNFGGAQRYVYDLATHLPKESYEPVVCFGNTDNSGSPSQGLAPMLTEAGIRTLSIRSLGRDIALSADIRSFFALWRILKLERPDILHLNSSKAGALGAFAGRLARISRIVFTAHGWPFKEHRALLWRAGVYGASWITALLSHRVICVSNDDLSYARTMPFIKSKAVCIYNGIDQSAAFGSGAIIRDEFPKGVHITGTIGELTSNKNQRELIERAHRTPDMYVALVGDGELREDLAHLIKEYGLEQRVKMFGFLPALDVLKGFDTFALPSKKEGLPYVLLEARCAGLPIEAHPVGGVAEILNSDIREFTLDRMMHDTIACYHTKI